MAYFVPNSEDNLLTFLELPKSAVMFAFSLLRFYLFKRLLGGSSGRDARAYRLASSLKSIYKAFLKFLFA